jgi:YidC/Oxa1 family membrane protein insertase
MQAKNLLLFIAFCILVLVGWPYLEEMIWPRPKPQPESEKKEEAKTKPKKKPKKKKTEKKKEPEKKKPVEEARRPPRALKPHLYTMGGDGVKYHLRVVFTEVGAGIHRVTLTKFIGADADGKSTGLPLELVPADPLLPSNLFYHYANPGPKDDNRPSDALGVVRWAVVSRDARKKPGVSVDGDGVQEIAFKARVPGRKFQGLSVLKTFRLAPKEYHVRLTVKVRDERPQRDGARPRDFRYQLTGAHGLPIEGKWYTSTYRTAMVGTVDERGSLTRDVEEARKISVQDGGDEVPEGGSGNKPIQYAGVATQFFAAMTVVANTGTRKDIPPQDILEWARPTLESKQVKGKVVGFGGVGGRVDRFSLQFEDKKTQRFTVPRGSDLGKQVKPGDAIVVTYRPGDEPNTVLAIQPGSVTPKPFFDDITVRVNSVKFEVKPGSPRVDEFLLYFGPVKVLLLGMFSGEDAVSGKLVDYYKNDLHLNTLTDYHSDNIFGRFSSTIHWTDLLILCTNVMHWLLWVLHKVLPVYGLNIILLTVLVRGLMFPISRKQAYLSMKMQELAPEMKKVSEKYKNDPQARTQATMELYRKHGVNPFAGCLPLLLQMPIFLGLYYALQESIFFRLEPFLWVGNLTAPDMLFSWGESIPWISDPNNLGSFGYLGPYLNVLPIFAVTLMMVVQKMMTPPATDENQAFQQKLMKIMMIFMGLVFYKVAAGLCIYFIASSLWGIAERKLLPKRKPPAAPVAEPRGGTKGPTGGKGGRRGQPPKQEDKPFQKVRDWWADVLKQAKKK